MWLQVGGVALFGGEPTVNITALELAPGPMDGGATAIPQAPAGAGIKGLHGTLVLIE